jgi:hypothetical protein
MDYGECVDTLGGRDAGPGLGSTQRRERDLMILDTHAAASVERVRAVLADEAEGDTIVASLFREWHGSLERLSPPAAAVPGTALLVLA